MSIAIVDYDAGNIGSIKFALEQCGLTNCLVTDAAGIKQASRIILPGVGSFNKAMDVLRSKQLDVAINQAVLERQVPLLGICLGMQLLATNGYEGGLTKGLELIPGEVCSLRTEQNDVRLPHVGWNEIALLKSHPLFQGIPASSDCYFVHSYHFNVQSKEHVIAETQYGCSAFASIVMKDNVYGMQFHPEKSGTIGRQFLKNFALL